MSTVIILVPDDALLFDVAQQAIAKNLNLVSNGERYALSPIVPAGWHVVPAGDKSGELRRAA